MTKWKDPIAEAKREGWNECVEEIVNELESLPRPTSQNVQIWRLYERDLCIDRIRSLHKPTEESET